LAFEEKPDGVEVGVDVMRGELPSGLTFEGFLDVLDEQVRLFCKCVPPLDVFKSCLRPRRLIFGVLT
jgi:hypothetical protein